MPNPLIGIVKKAINKNDGVDKKKLILFFQDYPKKKTYQLENLIPLLLPEHVVIINADVTFENSEDSPATQLRNNIRFISPTSKVTMVEGTWKDGEIKPLYEGTELTKLELATPDLGLVVSENGVIYIYRSSHIFEKVTFNSGGLTEDQLETLRDLDTELAYPTAKMFLPSDLIKSGTKDISAWFSNTQDKERSYAILHKLNQAFWYNYPQVNLHLIRHRSDDDVQEAIANKVEHSQYVLVVGSKVTIHPVKENVVGEEMGYLYLGKKD